MTKLMESCNECPYSNVTIIKNSGHWYCNKFYDRRPIEFYVDEKLKVVPPYWCPIKNESDMSYYEKRQKLESLKPIVEWDDIKANTIYHIPPLINEKRKNIMVVYKGEYSCSYKEINDKNEISNIMHTCYKTQLMSRFLLPNKLIEYVIK